MPRCNNQTPQQLDHAETEIDGRSSYTGRVDAIGHAEVTTAVEPASDDANSAAVELRFAGMVESALTDPATAPNQGDEGAPDAYVVFEPWLLDALDGIAPGDELILLTWLDRARRDTLRVRPRGDPSRPAQGVFSTRSPDRPNPIGLHRVSVIAVAGRRLRVGNLEALDGTPVIDVKPVLSTDVTER